MSNALQVIETKFKSRESVNQLTMALGFRADDDNGRNKAFSYISSVLAEISKTAGDPYRDLTVCEPQSLVQCAIDAARFELAIDARQLAHIVKFGNKAQLLIGFRGYVSKITQHYPDANITAELIWQGDTLEINSKDGFDHYTLDRTSGTFHDDMTKLQGVMVVMSYTKGGRQYQHITTVSAKEIGKIKGVAKTQKVWDTWFTEKAKVAAIKRACKTVFAGVTGLQEMVRYDNATHFSPLKQVDAPKAGSIVDNINQSLAQKPEPETKQPEEKPAETGAKIDALCGTCGGSGVVEDAEGKGPCPDCQGVQS